MATTDQRRDAVTRNVTIERYGVVRCRGPPWLQTHEKSSRCHRGMQPSSDCQGNSRANILRSENPELFGPLLDLSFETREFDEVAIYLFNH